MNKWSESVIELVKDGTLTKEYVERYLKKRLDSGRMDNLSFIEIMDAIK